MTSVRIPRIHPTTGDQILPLCFLDSNDILQKLAVNFTLRFDDVLDPEILRSALQRLLQIGNWHQMGVRYKRNAEGTLEMHIPRHYDNSRPGFVWSHDNYQHSISENKLASRLPGRPEYFHPTVHEFPKDFERLLTRPGHPTKLVHWVQTDHPALSVHVVLFNDATLVSLSWPHIFLDALGQQSLLQAWQAVLEGREEDVPTFIPYEEDPIAAIATEAKPSDHVLIKSALTGIWFIFFVVSFIYEMVVHSKESGRTMRFPGPWVDILREQAMSEVRSGTIDGRDAFLSHGDVLLAFWCKTSLAAQHLRPTQPIQIINVMNLRGISDTLPIPGKSAYIGNAAISSGTFMTIEELQSLSIGQLAARIRADLNKQRQPEQVKAMVAWHFNNCHKRGGGAPVVGSWNQRILAMSNCTRARFYDCDFSSAVIKSGVRSSNSVLKLGQPSFVMANAHADGISARNAGALIGKDSNGDWWMNWTLRAEAWLEVEKAFIKA